MMKSLGRCVRGLMQLPRTIRSGTSRAECRSVAKAFQYLALTARSARIDVRPLAIEIDGTNGAFPRGGIEAAVLRINSVLVAFYRKPIDRQRFERFIVGGENDAESSLNFGELAGEKPLRLSKVLQSQSYKLTGSYFSYIYASRYQRAHGCRSRSPGSPNSATSINSLPDEMVSMNLGVALPPSARIKQSDVIAFQRRFELGAVAFEIGDSKNVGAEGELAQACDKDGCVLGIRCPSRPVQVRARRTTLTESRIPQQAAWCRRPLSSNVEPTLRVVSTAPRMVIR